MFGTFTCRTGSRYLVVCTGAEVVAKIPPLRCENSLQPGIIHRVTKCELIPYEDGVQISEVDARLLSSVDRLLSSGTFFFTAPGDDIGRTALLHRCQERSTRSASHALSSADSIFLWNHRLISSMSESSSVDKHGFRHWVSPLMQGFAQTRSFADAGLKHSITVISRRSVKQAGTRFNARGIDDEGSVAIFTETECIVTTSVGADGLDLFSFVQIRGSVPLFWSQANSSTVELTRNFEMTKSAFNLHIDSVAQRYHLQPSGDTGRLVIVNLLSSTKSGEALLTNGFNRHVHALVAEAEANNSTPLPVMVEFDFHRFVNSSRPLEESLAPLLDAVRPFIFHVKYFDERSELAETPGVMQDGLFRVNCLDCLDRTNAVQMMVAWESLMLAKFDSLPKSSPMLKEIFTDVWVRNGDAISKGYAGTGSVLSRLVRTAGTGGSRNQIATMLEHSWRSANRFLVANFDDSDRQSAISHLLKARGVSHQPQDPLKELEDVSIFVGTWNVNGHRMDEKPGVLRDFIPEAADIVIACFQETIDLTASSVLFASRGDDERNRVIDAHILQILDGGYVQVASESLVGLYVTVFVRRALTVHVDAVKTNRFKTGFGGTTGNKGAVAVAFRLLKTVEIEIVNVHLDSGSDRAEERMDQLALILANASCHKRTLLTSPASHHHRSRPRVAIVAGDFNFRCDGISPALAAELVQKDRLEKLRRFDPFLATADGNVLKGAGFREMPITFPPTYKFDPDGSFNDRRTPSWCDRVFFRTNVQLDAIHYDSINKIRLSDHKPVIAMFAFRASPETSGSNTTIHESPDVDGVNDLPPANIDLLSGDFDEAGAVNVLPPGPGLAHTDEQLVESEIVKPDDKIDKADDEWVDLLL